MLSSKQIVQNKGVILGRCFIHLHEMYFPMECRQISSSSTLYMLTRTNDICAFRFWHIKKLILALSQIL